MLSVSFPASINDGLQHNVLLYINTTQAVLRIDDGLDLIATLTGPVSDCGVVGLDCVLSVGQRSAVSGGGSGFFHGKISKMALFPQTVISVNPYGQ